MAASQRFDYFFDLPGELRKQILGHLVVKPRGIVIGERGGLSDAFDRTIGRVHEPFYSDDDTDTDGGSSSGSSTTDEDDAEDNGKSSRASKYKSPLNYFLVSQTFYQEVSDVYFKKNTFCMVTSGKPPRRFRPVYRCDRYGPHFLHGPEKRILQEQVVRYTGPCERVLRDPEYTDSRRRIRRIRLYLTSPRFPVVHSVFLPLADMVLAGELKHLDVRIWWFGARSSDFLSSIIMQNLYRVLKDPDLETAKLKVVAGHHQNFWCAFHASPHSASSSSVATCEADGAWRQAGQPQTETMTSVQPILWLDVDLDGLVGKHGKFEEVVSILKMSN